MQTLEFSKDEALFELLFWLQCMADHTRIVHDSLGPNQGPHIQQVEFLMKRFDGLVERVRKPLNISSWAR